MKITIIGSGNGGQAIAGYLSMQGYDVSVYDRTVERVEKLKRLGKINLHGCVEGVGTPISITSNISEAIKGAEIIMVTTVANAHQSVAYSIAPFIENGQVIILNPGRTCGALVFKQVLTNCGCTKRYYLGEAQTLIYACRITEEGTVNIIGVKDEVLLAGLPSSDTDYILNKITRLYPCFKKANSVLHTSLENIGAIFHPCVCLFNAATIERQQQFWFYRDMTNQIAHFIEKFDEERISVGKAYDINLLTVNEWIKFAYKNTEGDTLCQRMKNNPAYYDIKAPGTIFTRQLTEDIPTGVLPIMELGKAAGVQTPLLQSMIYTIEALLEIDFHSDGRSLHNLGLDGMSKTDIINYINNEQ